MKKVTKKVSKAKEMPMKKGMKKMPMKGKEMPFMKGKKEVKKSK